MNRYALAALAIALLCGAVVSPAPAAPATTAPAHNDLLASQPWSENSYGLMLRPPRGALLQHANADSALLRMGLPGSCTITLRIRTADKKTDVPAVVKEAIRQFASLDLGAQVLVPERSDLKVNGRPAGLLYVKTLRRDDADHWLAVGQGLVQVDPLTFALLELSAPVDELPRARPVFEAVFNSIDLIDWRKLNDEHKQWIERGAQWHKTVDAAARRAVLIPEQLQRIVKDGHDIGYVKTCEAPGREGGNNGVRIDISSRIYAGDKAFDTASYFFLSDDGKEEVWSVQTATHPLGPVVPRAAPDTPLTWFEVGSRSGTVITVRHEGPNRKPNKDTWDLADKELPATARDAYLSAVEVHLLDRLLPHHAPAELGFYAYHPKTASLSMRSVRVVPGPGGRFDIFTRPALDQFEDQARYNEAGTFVEQVIGEGEAIKPTTAAELQTIWKTH